MSKKHRKKVKKHGKEANKQLSISLSMIVKNEEKFLEGCLQSVKDLVNEIIIVDIGSTDNTKKIAEKFGAKIYDHEWKNDFAEARNFALKKTSGDWVIYLDADERLPQKYHSDVKRIINANQHDALITKIRSEVSGPLGNVPHFQTYPRIFRNGKKIKFVYPVHEQILPSLIDQKFRMIQTGIMIEHLGYAQDDDIIYDKIDRNREFLEQQIENEPDNAYAHYQYAQTLRLLSNRENEAFAMYEIAISLSKNQKGIKATSLLQLASMKIVEKKYDEVLQYINESLKTTNIQTYGIYMKAEVLFLKEKYEEALLLFEQVNKLNKIPFAKRLSELLTEKEISQDLLLKRILSCHLDMKNFEKADELFFSSYKNITTWSNSWMAITSAILQTGMHENIPFGEIFHKIVTNPETKEQKIRIAENMLQVDKWLQFPEVISWINENMEIITKTNPEYYFYFAQIFFNIGNYEESYKLILSYTECYTEEITAWEFQGTIEIKTGNLLQAVNTYEHLLFLQQDNLQYYKILGGLFAKTGNMGKASEMAMKLKEFSKR